MHNKTQVSPKGSTWITLQRNGHTYRVNTLVVPGIATPLLSLKTSQQLGLVKIVDGDHLHTVVQQSMVPNTASRQPSSTETDGKMNNDPILEEYSDVFRGLGCLQVIANDFLVIGRGETQEAAMTDHNENLRKFLDRARERNLKLSLEKARLRLTEVTYVGHRITAKGITADPSKVEAIVEMPTPTDVKALRRVLGMVNYLAKFLPRLSETCDILRELERKETEWCWLEQHDQAWKEIKRLVTTPILAYYDPQKEVTIQCNASQSGLGAALLQEGRPICIASRALSTAQRNYAHIEKELLAIVFACERFDQYVYARVTKVETDHKPLEAISRKNMMDIPKRLQRMILRLQRYDLQIAYKKGSEMYVADTLSRACLQESINLKWQSEFCMQLEEVNSLG